MKNTIILTLLGALAGIAAASYLVPSALSWYAEPGGLSGGGQVQVLGQMGEIVRTTTARLIRAQQIGAAIGAVVGLAFGIVLVRRGRARGAVAPGTP
jgi:hypothetical protein